MYCLSLLRESVWGGDRSHGKRLTQVTHSNLEWKSKCMICHWDRKVRPPFWKNLQSKTTLSSSYSFLLLCIFMMLYSIEKKNAWKEIVSYDGDGHLLSPYLEKKKKNFLNAVCLSRGAENVVPRERFFFFIRLGTSNFTITSISLSNSDTSVAVLISMNICSIFHNKTFPYRLLSLRS